MNRGGGTGMNRGGTGMNRGGTGMNRGGKAPADDQLKQRTVQPSMRAQLYGGGGTGAERGRRNRGRQGRSG